MREKGAKTGVDAPNRPFRPHVSASSWQVVPGFRTFRFHEFREHGRTIVSAPTVLDRLDRLPYRIFVFAFEESYRRECGIFPVDFDAEPVPAEGFGNDARRIRPREDIDYQVAGFRQEVGEERRQSGGKPRGVPLLTEGLDDAM